MVHRVVFRVGSEEALDFWRDRMGGTVFRDPEGLELEVVVDDTGDPPLVAKHPEIPEAFALRGFAGVRAFASQPERSAPFLSGLGFTEKGEGWETRGTKRGGFYVYDLPPASRGLSGAGSVHHVAWACELGDEEQWRERVRAAGGQPTPVIDRFYFHSVYFREPSGVLFEIATLGPGFTSDEPLETLGEALSLPPSYEPYREQLERTLTPLPKVR